MRQQLTVSLFTNNKVADCASRNSWTVDDPLVTHVAAEEAQGDGDDDEEAGQRELARDQRAAARGEARRG